MDSSKSEVEARLEISDSTIFVIKNLITSSVVKTKKLLSGITGIQEDKLFVFLNRENNKHEWFIKLRNRSISQKICNQLNGMMVKGRKLETRMDVDGEFDKVVDMSRARYLKKRKLDTVEFTSNMSKKFDPYFTFGLTYSYLKSFGIKPPLSTRIFVKNVPKDITTDAIRALFTLAGEIRVIRRYGEEEPMFKIEFNHPLEAVQAVTMFHRQSYYERHLDVSMAQFDSADDLDTPDGISFMGPGAGPDGDIMKDVRVEVELTRIKKQIKDIMKQLTDIENEDLQGSSNTIESTPQELPDTTDIPNKTPKPDNETQTGLAALELLSTLLNPQGPISALQNLLQQSNISTLNNPFIAPQNAPPPINQQSVTPFPNIQQINAPKTHQNLSANISNVASTINQAQTYFNASQPPPQNFGQRLPNVQQAVEPNSLVWNTKITRPVNKPPNDTSSQHSNIQNSNIGDYFNRQVKNKDENPSEMLIFDKLPPSVTWTNLFHKMSEIGELKLCKMTGEGRASVCFAKTIDALRCLSQYNNAIIDGVTISVTMA